MNFAPKFEQYKADQKEIEKIPTIKPEFHSVVNDIAKKIITNEELTQKEIDDLEMVYDSTQDLEKDLVTFLDYYRSKDIITKPDFLVTSDYFLTANQVGPDSTEVRDAIIGRTASLQSFDELTSKVSIPENTRNLISVVYEKISKA